MEIFTKACRPDSGLAKIGQKQGSFTRIPTCINVAGHDEDRLWSLETEAKVNDVKNNN